MAGPSSKSGIIRLPEIRPALQALIQLARAIRSGRPHPSILLIGPTGSGKSTLVKHTESQVSRWGLSTLMLPCRELSLDTPDPDLAPTENSSNNSPKNPSRNSHPTHAPLPDDSSFGSLPDDFSSQPNVDIPDATGFTNEGSKVTFLSKDWTEPELMIFEDLQFLPSRSTAQLIHILDQREQVEKATLITSVRSPITIEGFPNRLLSRLARFLVLSIPNLSFESRLLFLSEILREKAKDHLTPEAQIWFAKRVTSLRELVALPQRIEPLKKLQPPPWDVPSLFEFFEAEPKTERPPLETLTIRVAEKYQLRWRELLGKSRVKIVVRARHVAMTLARRKGYSLNEIGAYFGGRDHKSVSHAVHTIEELIKKDLSLEKELNEMLQQ